MRQRINSEAILVVALFAIACILGVMSRHEQKPASHILHVAYNDATPLGGKGMHLMLERLGYTVKRARDAQSAMPADARVWMILDPSTTFSHREADDLLKWVENGGTLIWDLGSPDHTPAVTKMLTSETMAYLRTKLSLDTDYPKTKVNNDDPLPDLSALQPASVNVYWTGVNKLQGSTEQLAVARDYLEIAGTKTGPQLVRLTYGKGRIFVSPDGLLFTNYALSKPDNATFASNLIGYNVPPSAGAIYIDERNGADIAMPDKTFHPSLIYYLWQPPLRYAVFQLLFAMLLAWLLYARRLGAPVPLPEQEPVTRASRFAMAMGGLFMKANRPHAAATIIGDEFRRRLTHGLGLTLHDEDEAIAARAAVAADLPPKMVLRLLERAKNPLDEKAELLSDAQEMEGLLKTLEHRIVKR